MLKVIIKNKLYYMSLCIAPLCPSPPEKKFEGKLTHVPAVIDVAPEEFCTVDGEPVDIKCHSFLNIYIISSIYGRKKANGNKLCNGKEDTVKLQTQDCLDVDSELKSLHNNCRGDSECKSYWVPAKKKWTGECNETLTRKNELTVVYRCGKFCKYSDLKNKEFFAVECYYWVDYVQDPDCLDTALLQNSWIEEESLAGLQEADKKNILISKLNKNLNSEIHSLSDLSMRPVYGSEDGLCGIAAFYQALSSSVFTKSQLKNYDYGSMKKHVLDIIEHSSSYTFPYYNSFKKKLKKNDRLLLHKLHTGNYGLLTK